LHLLILENYCVSPREGWKNEKRNPDHGLLSSVCQHHPGRETLDDYFTRPG
jgi:hypothetical protein